MFISGGGEREVTCLSNPTPVINISDRFNAFLSVVVLFFMWRAQFCAVVAFMCVFIIIIDSWNCMTAFREIAPYSANDMLYLYQ